FLFNHAGSPWLTQYWSRQVVRKVYGDLSPEAGYSGDEDQGLMGALAVLMKIGIFSMDGGTSARPVYEIGSPVFDKVVIELDPNYYPGKEIRISTQNQGEESYYVQSASWKGKEHDQCWIFHDEFIKGGELILNMGDRPNENWGVANPVPE
ncbi:MAG: glycoside hydrolase family 92 protein, partial [Saprospiraceae bacterium]|nr:glycoside hydrolase family 92 protein [Saprospiraceae bacterium]